MLQSIKNSLFNSIHIARGGAIRINSTAKVRKCVINAANVEHSAIVIEASARVRRCKIVVEGTNNKLIIEDGCQLQNLLIEVLGNNCTIVIGKGTRNTGEGKISCQENGTTLKIGENCLLARGITILTSDGHDILQDGKRINPADDILIEDRVWLCQDAMILKGAHVGCESVVGARSVVTGIIPRNVIAAGSPARPIQERITWNSSLTFNQ